MSLDLVLFNRPAALAVTLDEVKTHLRLAADATDEDYLLLGLVEAATQMAENRLRQKIMTQTWDWYVDDFSDDFGDGFLTIPIGPLLAVTSLSYYDTLNVLTVWDAANYWVDLGALRARIVPKESVSWPTLYPRPQAVKIRLSVGYGTREAVPRAIRTWITCMVGTLYENRETVAPKEMMSIGALDGLLDVYRVVEI